MATIVVVAKCPLPGQCKTRLIDLLGSEGSAALARAMLSDIVTSISQCPELNAVHKILLYAPPIESARLVLQELLDEILPTNGTWRLCPVPSHETTPHDMQSAHLSDILVHAVQLGRLAPKNATVVLLGMDAPELPLDELVACCHVNSHANATTALLCPADDGGYGLLSIPSGVNVATVFDSVLWSHPLTALSQLKALTDQHVSVTLGPVLHDIDTPQDVQQLVQRLHNNGTAVQYGCLDAPSALAASRVPVVPSTTPCVYTRRALMALGLLTE